MKKNTSNTVLVVTDLVKPITDSLGLTIWDVEFEKEGSMWILRVIIDKEGGVSVDDCEAVSRPLDAKLDEVDPIDQSYCLEVSSAGIERHLSKEWHFAKCMGEKISLRLIRPYNGERDFIGELTNFVDNSVSIKTNVEEYTFNLSDVAFVRLHTEF
ncbi:MAG: ribosome maturation factor RimP [Oscillospiraceae bacterium]